MTRPLSILAISALISASTLLVAAEDKVSACSDVFDEFMPCMGFVEGIFRQPARECCEGVRRLNEIVEQKRGDTERVCECVEIMANAKHLPFLANAIKRLPSMCSLRLSFPISVALDCSQFRNIKDLQAQLVN